MAKGTRLDHAAHVNSALGWMKAHGTARYRDQLAARFGIHVSQAFGTSMVDLKRLAKTIGKDHDLALALWKSEWYEAKLLAALIDDPAKVTPAQMDDWCADFDNWATCDTACFALFDKTPHAPAKVKQWAKHKPEFERRAAFALLASGALHDKKGGDDPYLALLPLCEATAGDERNFVKKAVSWALRSIGSRSPACHAATLELAQRLAASDDRTRRWVGKDVLRDITRPMVRQRAAKRDTERNQHRTM